MEPDEENAQLVLLNGDALKKEAVGTNTETVEHSTGRITFRSASSRIRGAIVVINTFLLLIGKWTLILNI